MEDPNPVVERIVAALRHAPANTAGMRAVRKRFSKELAEVDRGAVLTAAQELIERAPFARFVAYEIVRFHLATMQSISEEEVENLGQGMKEWGDVDSFACLLAGPAWFAERVSDKTVRRWAQSPDRWRRRAALVSTVPLNSAGWAGAKSVKRTLAICRLVMSDRDDMVVKALSWALRAAAKHDPDSVRAFLNDHEKKLAARVMREVQNKLTTGLKNPRRLEALPNVF
jgi:3-methyladenine DNA glycosylase AlkD